MPWWKPASWVRWQKFTALSGFLSAVAYVLQILAGDNHWATWVKWLITIGGAVSAGFAVWLPIREQKSQEAENARLRSQQEQFAQERTHQAIKEVVLPVAQYIHLIGGLAPSLRTNREEALKGKAVTSATHGARDVLGVRASYYDFTSRALRCAAQHSAGSESPDDLTTRTNYGRLIINHAKQGRGFLEADLTKSAAS
ncbi:hypothetical protein Scel_60640 [Streptomyces cellostaticus]|nr:hypothetical protein Scel_60640 [Streptomyces cellostaticus]